MLHSSRGWASGGTRFAFAPNNYAAIVLAPALVAAVAQAAPSVALDLRPSGTLAVPDLLGRGELDLAIGYFAAPGERFDLASLADDRFAVAMRRDQPAHRWLRGTVESACRRL